MRLAKDLLNGGLFKINIIGMMPQKGVRSAVSHNLSGHI
jgi:hypothetical protein